MAFETPNPRRRMTSSLLVGIALLLGPLRTSSAQGVPANPTASVPPAPTDAASGSPVGVRPLFVTPCPDVTAAITRRSTGVFEVLRVQFSDGRRHLIYALVHNGRVVEMHAQDSRGRAWQAKESGSFSANPVFATSFQQVVDRIGAGVDARTLPPARRAEFTQLTSLSVEALPPGPGANRDGAVVAQTGHKPGSTLERAATWLRNTDLSPIGSAHASTGGVFNEYDYGPFRFAWKDRRPGSDGAASPRYEVRAAGVVLVVAVR